MQKKVLIFSMHLEGGCFQYSNHIIANMQTGKEVWIPRKLAEPGMLKECKTLLFWGYPKIIRLLSLAFFLLRMLFCATIGRYSALIIFGATSWDYYVMKTWSLTKLPSFYVVHDGKMHEGEQNNKTQRQLVRIMKMSTHLIFLSNYVRNLVKNNFNVDKPCMIVPHGLIDYGMMPPCEKFSKKPSLLFLGRISKYKGAELLIESMKKVDDDKYYKLIIAGKWDYALPKDYNKKKIEIVDKWLSNDEILGYLSQADIMVFPYLEATQSGVATLAINYIKPSIVTKVGAFAEQFDKGSVIYVKPNAHELASAINNLLDDNQKLAAMKCAMERLKNKYSWHNIVKEFELQLNDIINNHEKNSPPPPTDRKAEKKEQHRIASCCSYVHDSYAPY